MNDIQKELLKVLASNVSESELVKCKAIAYDLTVGDRKDLTNHLFDRVLIHRELYADSSEKLAKGLSKYGIMGVDIDATYNKHKELKTRYFNIHVEGVINNINVYNKKPFTVTVPMSDGSENIMFESMEEIAASIAVKANDIVFYTTEDHNTDVDSLIEMPKD